MGGEERMRRGGEGRGQRVTSAARGCRCKSIVVVRSVERRTEAAQEAAPSLLPITRRSKEPSSWKSHLSAASWRALAAARCSYCCSPWSFSTSSEGLSCTYSFSRSITRVCQGMGGGGGVKGKGGGLRVAATESGWRVRRAEEEGGRCRGGG